MNSLCSNFDQRKLVHQEESIAETMGMAFSFSKIGWSDYNPLNPNAICVNIAKASVSLCLQCTDTRLRLRCLRGVLHLL